MVVFSSIKQYNLGPCAITVGSFDGVHLGHLSVFKSLIDSAKQNNLKSVVLTFANHPQHFFYPNKSLRLLTPPDEKNKYLQSTGIDAVIEICFDSSMANLEYCDFVKEVLFDKVQAHIIVMGYDHKFGKFGAGSFELVRECALRYGVTTICVPELFPGEHLSSSRIRKLLSMGEVGRAAKLLGRFYDFHATVIHGRRLGRTIGFPTANLSTDSTNKLMPAFGVYLVGVSFGDSNYFGIMNYGVKPTIESGLKASAEVHIINFEGSLYGKLLQITLLERIREEKKFNSLEELRLQLEVDKTRALSIAQKIEIDRFCL